MGENLSDSATESYSDSEFSTDDEANDSDRELQIAYQKGLLKPGLMREVRDQRSVIHVNNTKELKEKLESFKLSLPWLQTLALSCKPAPLAPELATQLEDKKGSESKNSSKSGDLVYDDFAREMMFYRLAQAGVLEGIPKLHALNVLTRRPNDYFAEMAKTDEHMHKVREKLKVKENAILVREKAKKLRELKKFGKKVQAERNVQKQEEKRKMLDQLKKYRKGKMDSLDFLDDNAGKKTYDDENSEKPRKNKKLQNKKDMKNKKFGVAGKKRGWKRNAAGDVDSVLSSKRNKFGKGKQKKNMKDKRPGKNFRDKVKANKGRRK